MADMIQFLPALPLVMSFISLTVMCLFCQWAASRHAGGHPPGCLEAGRDSVGQALPPAFQLAVVAAVPARHKGRATDQRVKQRGRAGTDAIAALDRPVMKIEGHYCLLLLKRLAQAREANAISDRRDEHR